MVGPVNGQVAVDATSVVQSRTRHDTRGSVRPIVMPGIRVALLAEAGHLHPEEALKIRAVRLVTVQAVLHDRRMRPQERPALGGVAARTAFVDGHRRDQLLGGRPVRVVAAPASHPPTLAARGRGHVRRPLKLHSPHLVTLAAQVVLGSVQELAAAVVPLRLDDLELGFFGAWAVDGVAGRAGDIPGLVRAARPEDLLSPGVALQADRILVRRAQRRFLPEPEIPCRVGRILHVLAARSVAALAPLGLQWTLGEFRAQELAVQALLHLLGDVFVTALTGLASNVGGANHSWWCRLSGRRHEQGDDSQDPERAHKLPGWPHAQNAATFRSRNDTRFHAIPLPNEDNSI